MDEPKDEDPAVATARLRRPFRALAPAVAWLLLAVRSAYLKCSQAGQSARWTLKRLGHSARYAILLLPSPTVDPDDASVAHPEEEKEDSSSPSTTSNNGAEEPTFLLASTTSRGDVESRSCTSTSDDVAIIVGSGNSNPAQGDHSC